MRKEQGILLKKRFSFFDAPVLSIMFEELSTPIKRDLVNEV